MSVLGRRVTPEQLASELLRGLESGEIVFDEDAWVPDGAEQLRATLVAAAAAATLDEARAILAEAVRAAERLCRGNG